MRRILEMMRKEFLQILRDKRFLPLILLSPVLQLFLFGYAATQDVRHIRLGVLDEDRTGESRRLVNRFLHCGYFRLVARPGRRADLYALLERGEADLVLLIPSGFASLLGQGRRASVQVIQDGTNASQATIIGSYAQQILAEHETESLLKRLRRFGIPPARLRPLQVEERTWYNPELRSANYMVPGTVCLILLILTTTYTATAVIREKERGPLEQLSVLPIARHELLLGKVLPYCLIGMVEVCLILVVAVFWFEVPLRGNLGLLFACAGVFLLSTTGTGLFVSTVASTQQQAVTVNLFVNNLQVLLSGFMFPIENMPPAVQAVSYLLPVRYFLRIIRGIFLKGSDLQILWPEIWPLAVFGLVIMSLSVWRFRKQLG